MNDKYNIERFGEETKYAVLASDDGRMMKFVWFADETIRVENGKEVLIIAYGPKSKKWSPIGWYTKKDSRQVWNKLVSKGFNRMSDAIEYFADLASGGTGGHD